ncbi:hypothetical protein CEXT_391761 [Caerostris extrusa]|uniref:Uncharacterized protein n=1 Tax=Caerostris extrusa TaxID=172846 RepID=A0AAV4UEG8_CAEEX|nr:hypothetical protein CEXT_391761 [Caerostris extrusa]
MVTEIRSSEGRCGAFNHRNRTQYLGSKFSRRKKRDPNSPSFRNGRDRSESQAPIAGERTLTSCNTYPHYLAYISQPFPFFCGLNSQLLALRWSTPQSLGEAQNMLLDCP